MKTSSIFLLCYLLMTPLLGQETLDFTFSYNGKKCRCEASYQVLRKTDNNSIINYPSSQKSRADITISDDFSEFESAQIIVRLIASLIKFKGKCPMPFDQYYLHPVIEFNSDHFSLKNQGSTKIASAGGYFPILFTLNEGNSEIQGTIKVKYEVRLKNNDQIIDGPSKSKTIKIAYNITPPLPRTVAETKTLDESVWEKNMILSWQTYINNGRKADDDLEQSLLNFISNFPKSKYLSDAQQSLKDYYSDRYKGLSDSKEDLEAFIARYPESEKYGGFITMAKKSLADLGFSVKDESDRDGDGISNDYDECPDEPGNASANGCPDKDSDGVADQYDRCPYEVGPKSNNGCPVASPEEKDEEAWATAQALDTRESYGDYLDGVMDSYYPGKYKEEALSTIDQIGEAEKMAIDSLDASLMSAGEDPVLKCQAYSNYLERTQDNPSWHRRRAEAQSYIQRNQCSEELFLLEVEKIEPGSVQLKLISNLISDADDLVFEFMREGQAVPEGNYILSEEKSEDGQFLFLIEYVENGNNTFTIAYDGEAQKRHSREVFMTNVPVRVLDLGRQIRITGAEPPYSAIGMEKNGARTGEIFRFTETVSSNQRIFSKPIFNNRNTHSFLVISGNKVIDDPISARRSSLISPANYFPLIAIIVLVVLFLIFRGRIKMALRKSPTARILFKLSPPIADKNLKEKVSTEPQNLKRPFVRITGNDSYFYDTNNPSNNKDKDTVAPSDITQPILSPKVNKTPKKDSDEPILSAVPPIISNTNPEQSNELFNIDLSSIWKDTFVSEVNFSKQFASYVNTLLQDELKGKSTSSGPYLYLEGFLLGNSIRQSYDSSSVIVEEFIPNHFNNNQSDNPNFLAPVQAALKRFRDLKLIGWLVTHPSFPIEITQKEIQCMNRFFTEKTQLCIVIDPLSKEKEMIVFSRKSTAELNHDLKLDALNQVKIGWNYVEKWLKD
jgi:hypothetical protein